MTIKSSTTIETEFGPFLVRYHEAGGAGYISFSYGDISKGTPIVRIHSACLFGEAFHSLHCDCNHQLTETMRLINQHGCGIIVYSYQEGRGIGLEKKIQAMELERSTGCDTVEAFKKLGLEKPDFRNFTVEVQLLLELGVEKSIFSFSGNPLKRKALENAGIEIVAEKEIKSTALGEIALREKTVKKEKMGYSYKN